MDGKIEQKLQGRNSQENEISDQLISFLNGNLTDKERRPVENHLRRCKACQRELEFLKLAKKVQEEDFASAAFAFLKRRA